MASSTPKPHPPKRPAKPKENKYFAFQVVERNKKVSAPDEEVFEIQGTTPAKAIENHMEVNESQYDWEYLDDKTVWFAVVGFESGLKSEVGVVLLKVTKTGFRVE